MKFFYKGLAVLAVPALLLLYSYSGGSPGGKTGSPGDGGTNCTMCHTGNSVITQTGWITSDIPAEGYTPGETYTITATGTSQGVVKFGFELTAEDDAGNKLGGLAITDAARTQFTNNNNAVTHTQAGNVPNGDTNTWSMDWTAPDGVEGDIWFYAAFNAANGNGNNQGDQIYTSNLTVSKFVPAPAVVSVDPDHAEQGWEGSVTILGENTTWGSGVFSVMFRYHADPTNSFTASNIQVKNDGELTCDVAVPAEQLLGTYDVYVDAAVLMEGFTVDVASGVGEDLLAAQIKAWPNPSAGIVNLDMPEESVYRVIGMNGQLIIPQTENKGKETINLSDYESGIYFVQVIHEGKSATIRLLKN